LRQRNSEADGLPWLCVDVAGVTGWCR